LQRAISEQSLAESEAQLRTTIDGMDAALHVVDQDLRLVLGNALFGRWLEAYGLEGDYAGKELGSVCPFLDDASLAEYRKIFVTGRPLVTEEANRVNGATIYTETHRLPIVQDGAVRQVITMIRDVSERRQADETLRESERSLARAQQVGVVGSWEWDVGGRPTDVV
jgi:PAS domain S-box-containing protein